MNSPEAANPAIRCTMIARAVPSLGDIVDMVALTPISVAFACLREDNRISQIARLCTPTSSRGSY